jgi:GAF domain-containing protein
LIEQKSNHEVFESLLISLLEFTGSEYGFIGEIFYDEKNPKGFLRVGAWTNIAWNEETRALYEKYKTGGMEFRNLDTLFGEVITGGKSVISNDPSTDPQSGGIPEGHPPLNAFMGTPIYKDNKLTGMIGIANRSGGYNQQFEERLQPFVNACAIIIAAMQRNKKSSPAQG